MPARPVTGFSRRTEERNLEATPVEKKPVNRKMLYAVVAVIVVAIIVIGAVAVILSTPPRKYQLELWFNSDGHYGDTEDELATVLKNSIEVCGKVTVTLKSEIWADFRQSRNQGELPFFLLGWYPDYSDTDDYLSPFLASSGSPSFGSFYSNATVDQWVTEEQTTTNAAIRADRFTKLQDKLAADVPYIPLFSGYSEAAYVSNVLNVELHPIMFKLFIIDKPNSAEFNLSTTDDITSLDPALAYDYFSIELVNQIFDTLITYEPVESRLIASLATTVPTVANLGVSADGKNYTYVLRPDLKFSDGTALNATVVKRSIDRAIRINDPGGAAFLLYDTGKLGRNAANGNNSDPGAIEVQPDDLTITFHLSAPVAFFNDLIAFSVSSIVPWDYNQNARQPDAVGSVVGSGPYTLTGYVPNQQFVLEKNALYNTPSLYSSFGIPTIPVDDTVTVNLRSGGSTALKQDLSVTPKLADIVYRTLTPDDLRDLQTQATSLGLTVDIAANPFIRYLVFNVQPGNPVAITDLRVRQAIAYSVDRQAIDRDVFQNNVDPLYSLVPPGFSFSAPYYKPVFQTEYGDAACADANAIWTQLGYAASFGTRELIARDL